MTMIPRNHYITAVSTAIRRSPVCGPLGLRQCGKTTLARIMAQHHSAHYFDLESEPDRCQLQNPELMLGSLSGLVILDEIQLVPQLFSVLQVLVDRPDSNTRYLVLGSASPPIVKGVAETLAGRIEFVDLAGFDLSEIPAGETDKLWLRGGVPRSFLAASEADSLAWADDTDQAGGVGQICRLKRRSRLMRDPATRNYDINRGVSLVKVIPIDTRPN